MRFDELDLSTFYDTVFLFEGKLLLSEDCKVENLKEHLETKHPNLTIKINDTRNWDHWSIKFKKEMILYNE